MIVKDFGSDCLYDSVSLAVTSGDVTGWMTSWTDSLGVVCADEGHT